MSHPRTQALTAAAARLNRPQVPPLATALRQSAFLRGRPAHRTAWLVLLATAKSNAVAAAVKTPVGGVAPAARGGAAAAKAADEASALVDEAVGALEDLVRDIGGAGARR